MREIARAGGVLELPGELALHRRHQRARRREQPRRGGKPKVHRDGELACHPLRPRPVASTRLLLVREHLVPPVRRQEEALAGGERERDPLGVGEPGEGPRPIRPRQVDLRPGVEGMVDGVGIDVLRLLRVEDPEGLGARELHKEVVVLVKV